MNKYIKIYVGRGFENNELIDDLFHDGYKSEACMKQQKRNIRQFKKAVKNNNDIILAPAYKSDENNWDDYLYIYDHREFKQYIPNDILVLTLGGSIPKKSLEGFKYIDLFEYLEASGINMELFERISYTYAYEHRFDD